MNPILKLDVSERLLSGFESGKLDFHFSVKKLTQHCWHLKVWSGPLRKRWIEKSSAHHCQHQVKWGVDMKYSEEVKNCYVMSDISWQSLPVEFIILQIGFNETVGPNHINIG